MWKLSFPPTPHFPISLDPSLPKQQNTRFSHSKHSNKSHSRPEKTKGIGSSHTHDPRKVLASAAGSKGADLYTHSYGSGDVDPSESQVKHHRPSVHMYMSRSSKV